MGEVLYPELSYKLVGTAFEIYNNMGWGHKELYYQRAFCEELKRAKLSFEREKAINLEYKGVRVGRYILDFVVDDKIVVELKVRPRLGYTDVKQVSGYLKNSKLKLALLIYFTKEGVKYRRILNAY